MKRYAVQMLASGHWETIYIAYSYGEAELHCSYVPEYVTRIVPCLR